MYANGHVTIQPLPPELHGSQVRRTLPLRRIEAVLEQAEAEEHLSKELLKVTLAKPPAGLCTLQMESSGRRRCNTPVWLDFNGLHSCFICWVHVAGIAEKSNNW